MHYYSSHPEKAICLDVETTGVDPSTAEILQLSIIDFNGKVLFNEFVKPDRAKIWPGAERIHHISPIKIMKKPHLSYYRDKLERIFNNAELIIAYNGNHYDIPIIMRYGFHELRSKKSFDVMLEFAPIYGAWDDYHGSYTWQKLSVCASYYGYKNSNASFHDSLEDVRATLYCYKKMIASPHSKSHSDYSIDDNEENGLKNLAIPDLDSDDDEEYELDDECNDDEYEYTDEDAIRDTQPFWTGAEMEMEDEQNQALDDNFSEEDEGIDGEIWS